jgi:hypothetical protein
VLVPLSATLNPGHYALIFGSGEFGANSYASGMQTNNIDIPGAASYFQWFIGPEAPEGVWRDIPVSYASGLRFVVTGSVIPEPATWLLAAVATALLLIPVRRPHGVPRTVVATFALLVLGATPSVRAEVLEGHTVATTYVGNFPHNIPPAIAGPVNSVVGPTTELTDFRGLEVDFSDTSILITRLTGFVTFYVDYLIFEDAFGTIPRFTAVSLNPASTWEGFGSSGIHVEANRIRLTMPPDPFGDPDKAGQQISLDLTGMIPEPSTLLLGAMASAGLLMRRRGLRQ